jgi:1-phosphofructokinase
MGGSLPKGVPPDFYAEAIEQAHVRGVPVIFDSSGLSLAAGIKSGPDLIKPNQAEVSELLGTVPASREEALYAAQKLHNESGANVIITLGSEGAMAVFAGASYFVHPISVPVVSSAGAGDGVLAGMALTYDRQESPAYGLQHGFALAGAVLQTLATADFRIEDYQTLLPQVRIEQI